MKTLEKYLLESELIRKDAKITDNFALSLTRDCHVGTVREILNLIKQVQIESYNQAVEDCISTIDPWRDDKASLLKLKRK